MSKYSFLDETYFEKYHNECAIKRKEKLRKNFNRDIRKYTKKRYGRATHTKIPYKSGRKYRATFKQIRLIIDKI